MKFFRSDPTLSSPDATLPGRSEPLPVPNRHFVNGASLTPPWPDGTKTAIFAMGCFWGAEKDFWQTPGVISTAVGYAGGYTPNADYREVGFALPAAPAIDDGDVEGHIDTSLPMDPLA